MNTGAVLFNNNASSRLKIDIPAASPTITVDDGTGVKFPQPVGDGSNWFIVTVEDRRTGQVEIMECTQRVGDILTVTRAQEGTVAQDFTMGASVSNRLTAGTMATFFEFNGYSMEEADDRFINAAGDEMMGPLILPAGPPTDPEHAANKQYVDDVSIDEAPIDGRAYARSMEDWTPIGTGIAEAPNDGLLYGRGNLDWAETVPIGTFDAEVASTDGEIAAINAHLTNIDATNTAQDNAIGANTSKNDSQDAALATLQTSDLAQNTALDSLDGRMDDAEADIVAHGDRLDAGDAKDTAQDGRLTAVETKNTTQDGRLTAVEGSNTAQDALIAGKVAKAGDTMTGNLIIEPAAATPQFSLRKPVGAFYNIINGLVGSLQRWQIIPGDNAAESGANAGSDFIINRFNDAGTFIDRVLGINRASGITTVKQLAVTTGPITVAGAPMVGGASMSDGPPASPVNGQFWYDTDSGNLYVWYVDANSSQWVQVNQANLAASGQVGQVSFFDTDVVPPGFLEANGASYPTAQYPHLFAKTGYRHGGGGANFNVIDARGKFLRGWDHGRGIDPGRVNGSDQDDAYENHTHTAQQLPDHYHEVTTSAAYASGAAAISNTGLTSGQQANMTSSKLSGFKTAGTPVINASTTGDTETRPVNVALLACVRYLPTIEGLVDFAAVTKTADVKNRIVNPAMQISQEWGSGLVGAGYPADQWYHSFTGGGAYTAQLVASTTPNKSLNRLQFKVTTADVSIAATDYWLALQSIEGVRVADLGWGAPGAKPVVVRFGFKGPAGTYGFAVHNTSGTATRSYLAIFTIAAGQANIDTEQVLIIPGDVTGTWPKDNTCGLCLGFSFMMGSTYVAPALGWNAGHLWGPPGMSNNAGVVGNTIEIFDVGLYADPDSTGIPPKWEMPDIATELSTCQRYWQEAYNIPWTNGVVLSQGMYGTMAFVVTPRPGAILSGTNVTASNFPATVGPLVNTGNAIRENRTASATANSGGFATNYVINARM